MRLILAVAVDGIKGKVASEREAKNDHGDKEAEATPDNHSSGFCLAWLCCFRGRCAKLSNVKAEPPELWRLALAPGWIF
jgi:hypothetical protein